MAKKKLDSVLEKKLSNVVLTLIKDKEQLNKVHKAYTKYANYFTKVGMTYPSDSEKLFSKISDIFQQYKNSYLPKNHNSKNEVPTSSGKGFIGGVKYN